MAAADRASWAAEPPQIELGMTPQVVTRLAPGERPGGNLLGIEQPPWTNRDPHKRDQRVDRDARTAESLRQQDAAFTDLLQLGGGVAVDRPPAERSSPPGSSARGRRG